MDLQTLATELRDKVSNNSLLLDNSTIQQESFVFVLSFFDNNKITLIDITDPDQQISVDSEGLILTITGTQNIEVINNVALKAEQQVSVSITLSQQDLSATTLDSHYSSFLDGVSFADLISWKIIPTNIFDPSPYLPTLPFVKVHMAISAKTPDEDNENNQTWSVDTSDYTDELVSAIGLTITKFGFNIKRTPKSEEGEYDTAFVITGNFQVGQSTTDISVTVPISEGDEEVWTLSLTSDETLAGGIADLSQLVFGNNLFAALPPDFENATSFGLQELEINFTEDEEDGGVVKDSTIKIGRTDDPWSIDSFTILDAGATFVLSRSEKTYVVATNIFGKFQVGTDNSPTMVLLDVTMDIPNDQTDWLAEINGSLSTNNIDDLFASLPVTSGATLPEFPIGLNLDSITLNYLKISFNPSSSSQKLTFVSFNVESELVFSIFDIISAQNPYAALDVKNPTNTANWIITGNVGGNLVVADVPFILKADKPEEDSGWTLTGEMEEDKVIPLLDLVQYFLEGLNITSLPSWVANGSAQLDITKVDFSAYVPTEDATDQSNKYSIEGAVMWQIDNNSFALNNLEATVKAEYEKESNAETGTYSGDITVSSVFLGLPFNIGYQFGTPDTEMYLEWLGIKADYKHNDEDDVDTITITFADMSVGEILTHLIASIDSGFKLPAPWDKLNAVNLSGLSFVYTRYTNDSSKDNMVIKYSKKIDLTFLVFTELTITKDNTGVFMGFEGTFLGLPITTTDPDTEKLAGKGSDVTKLGDIAVPGMGSQYFNLEYLGLGQHVSLYPFENLTTVEEAITALGSVFKDPPQPADPSDPPIIPIPPKPAEPPKESILIYNQDSNWLIATKFTIIEAITLGVVFNDPNLYGLLVELEGEKVKSFSGLKFQILYKKVSDSVGVYQIQLKLPDSIRELQFGAVSVTLPVIGIDIYTNGSFKLDFGFPYNMDFSNSLTIQAFPFTGSGGFYIAYLHDVPSDSVPTTEVGVFNPIIEFGLGLQLGIGKSINKGILKANFSVTILGIFEGVIAFYTPNSDSYPGKGDTYYKLTATVGIVGNLYGEVNFAIISASVDITVYAYVQMTVEAYKAIPVYLEAGVSVSLKVTINLGLFKVHTSLKFSTKVSASFVIGQDDTANAPWNYIPPTAFSASEIFLAENNSLEILWQPLILSESEQEAQTVDLIFFPQLTVADDNGTQQTQLANLLYIDAPENSNTVDSSLNNLVKGILYWCINAVINSNKTDTTLDDLKTENVSYNILKQLFDYLSDTQDNPTPIPYSTSSDNDIQHFLENYFTINVKGASAEEEQEINASIFPLLPELTFSWKLGDDNHSLTTYEVDESYIETIQEMFKEMQVNFQDSPAQEADLAEQSAHGVTDAELATTDSEEEPMPTFIFEDYTLMVAKSVIQDALDEFENFSYAPDGGSLQDVVDAFNLLSFTNPSSGEITTNTLTVTDVATANKSLPLTAGLNVQLANITYQVAANDSFNDIVGLFNKGVETAHQITPAQLNDSAGFNRNIQGLIMSGTEISIDGYTPSPYTVAPGQTLTQIAAAITSSSGAAISVDDLITAIADQKVLLSLAKMVIPTLIYTTGATDDLDSLATNYGLTIGDLAESNSGLENLFNAETGMINIPDLQVLGVETVVSTFDTNDNIARISGMASRYFLHGLRLPNPDDDAVTALYLLTGQQFAVPTTLVQDDVFEVLLSKENTTVWINFDGDPATNELNITIPNETISQINDLQSLQIIPDTSPLPPQSIPLGQISNQTFTMKPGIPWQYPGNISFPLGTTLDQSIILPSVWKFSDALMDQLEQPQPTGGLGLEVIKLIQQSSNGGFVKENVQNYAFSTFIEIGIQKIDSGAENAPILANTYEVIGANDTSIVFLERLIQYMNANDGDSFIQQIQILYPPANSSDTPTGLQSAANGNLTSALIQANLSTETNPASPQALVLGATDAESPNTLNTFQDFINLLWQCSIVRSGGYYLLYSATEGNEGLPDSLFSKSPNGNIYLLITYNQALSTDFVNSVAIADTIDSSTTTVYIETDNLQTTTAVVPPGNIGVETERELPAAYEPVVPYPIPPTPESIDQDKNYLENQFNLLGYQIIENDDFNPQASLLPIGPTNDIDQDDLQTVGALPPDAQADENWNYNTYFPIAAFAKNRIQPNDPSFPSAEADPYAGIGGTANIMLNWQDMLGNTLKNFSSNDDMNVQIKVGYTDNLIPLSKWTSITSYYSFPTVDGQPNVQLDLALDPSRYLPSSSLSESDAINNASIDQLIYQKAYYQLIQNDIKAFVTSSINAEASTPEISVETSVLSDFAGAVFAYLQEVINDPNSATVPDNLTISLPIDLNNSNKIFELTVELLLERTGDIDPAFENVETVKSISNPIKPITTNSDDNNDQTVSLTPFAQEFEATFLNLPTAGNFLKITTGIDRYEVTNNPNNKKVWVVHFDKNGNDGIYFSIQETPQNFFAPMPLENNLVTLDNVSINGYKSGESYPYGSPQVTTFSGIDLDNWGRQCLEAIDEFLSAEYATPAFLLDNGVSLQGILDAKEAIAEGIAGTVTNILATEGNYSLSDAQEKLKQRLLVQLSDAYKIDAIVQNAVTITDGFDTENPVPQLYGQMVGSLLGTTLSSAALVGEDENPSNEYSLSTAKIPLGTEASWLTYLFDAKEADKHSDFNFEDMTYQISYIEHQIGTVENMGDYQASSWLTFVIPLDASMMEVGAVDIPIPLRSYPSLPTVTSQLTQYDLTGGSDQTTTIEAAKQWGYQFSYQSSAISQDQFGAQVQFNLNPNTQLQAGPIDVEDDPLLPAALAQFISVYPAIRQDFENALLQVNINTQSEEAMNAVQAFSEIITNIGSAWKKWNQVQEADPESLLSSGSLQEVTYQWGIIEAPATEGVNTTDLVITINPALVVPDDSVNPMSPMPVITISGYDTEPYNNEENQFIFKNQETGEYLTYGERSTVPIRTLTIGDLGILDKQNAWGGVYLTRNQDLVENPDGTYKTTNPDFIYKTPMVKFYNQLVPLLVCNETINVAEINSPDSPQTLPLSQQLQNLFDTLMQNQEDNDQNFKVEVLYQYNLSGDHSFNLITLPILMTPPILYDLGSDTFSSNLTQVIQNWFDKHSPNETNGVLLFNIEIFSTDNSQLPVLKLDQVVLPVQYVEDL